MSDTPKFDMFEQTEDDDLLGEDSGSADGGCDCLNGGPNEYSFEVDSGSISLMHKPCGKPPWWILNDHDEAVFMDAITVSAELEFENVFPPGYDGGGLESITLTIKKESSSADTEGSG